MYTVCINTFLGLQVNTKNIYCGDHKGFWDLLKSGFGPALCVFILVFIRVWGKGLALSVDDVLLCAIIFG